jgi:hypothetical protein
MPGGSSDGEFSRLAAGHAHKDQYRQPIRQFADRRGSPVDRAGFSNRGRVTAVVAGNAAASRLSRT